MLLDTWETTLAKPRWEGQEAPEAPEAPEGIPPADGGGLPPVYQLEGLDQELDLSDAAPSKFDIPDAPQLFPDVPVDALL